MAANEQGKFWEMHDKLFANQQALDRAVAREVRAASSGSTWTSSRRTSTRGKFKDAINADVQYANSLGGGMGTPTFFINGHRSRARCRSILRVGDRRRAEEEAQVATRRP